MSSGSMYSLTAKELADARAALDALGDLSVTVQRKSESQGPTGNVKDTYAPVVTVKGSLNQPTAGMLQNYAYLVGNLTLWQVRLPYGTDVRDGDQLVIGSDTLDVQDVLAPRSYDLSVRVLASEVK